MQEQLQNVKQIRATDGAFAALRGDGSVVTWDVPNHGGSTTDSWLGVLSRPSAERGHQ